MDSTPARSNAQRLLVLLAAAVVALASGVALYSWLAEVDRKQQWGDTSLWTTSFPDIYGQPQDFTQWKGKVVVVNFWATWCQPCREEIPELAKIQTRYGERGMQMVGIAIDEKTAVTRFLKEVPVNYPVLVGGFDATRLSEQSGNKSGGLPFTLVLDRAGRVTTSYLGMVEPLKLSRTVERLL
jgi:thiol-disulfide isomerase/thioredoxin